MKHIFKIKNSEIVKDNAYLKFLEVEGDGEYEIRKVKGTRTQPQHNALFLWFGLIEKEAENNGITWDRIIRHIHQLRITKEGIHILCKELIKALWGYTSTKEIKKIGDLDIVQEHFIDLFAKEGMELPPFPSMEEGSKDKDGRIKIANY